LNILSEMCVRLSGLFYIIPFIYLIPLSIFPDRISYVSFHATLVSETASFTKSITEIWFVDEDIAEMLAFAEVAAESMAGFIFGFVTFLFRSFLTPILMVITIIVMFIFCTLLFLSGVINLFIGGKAGWPGIIITAGMFVTFVLFFIFAGPLPIIGAGLSIRPEIGMISTFIGILFTILAFWVAPMPDDKDIDTA